MLKTEKRKGRADKLDVLAACNLKRRRTTLGLSQNDLAKVLNVSIQQVQKYETGVNRISSGKMYLLSKRLGVSVEYFFDLSNDYPSPSAHFAAGSASLVEKQLDYGSNSSLAPFDGPASTSSASLAEKQAGYIHDSNKVMVKSLANAKHNEYANNTSDKFVKIEKKDFIKITELITKLLNQHG